MTSENSQNLVHYLKLYALNMLRSQTSLSAARISTSLHKHLVQEEAEPRTVVGSAPNDCPAIHQKIHTIPRGMGDHSIANPADICLKSSCCHKIRRIKGTIRY
jgi:hypothetical protein